VCVPPTDAFRNLHPIDTPSPDYHWKQSLFYFTTSLSYTAIEMYPSLCLPVLLAAGLVAAIDFTDYDAQPGVQPEFKEFLNA
jgi:hypothetical protein